MKVSDFVGKYATHKEYGRVFVDSAPKRSKKTVDITVVQRGKGWDDATETYRRFKLTTGYNPKTGDRSLRWGFTHNDEYGQKDQVSIDDLKLEA